MARRRGFSTLWFVVPLLISCGGNCSQNAVVVAQEVRALGQIVDTIEVFGDTNGDGVYSPQERVFVVDPRSSVDKILRVSFVSPVERGPLAFDPDPDHSFLRFDVLPPMDVGVNRVYFNDDPTDTDPGGARTQVVTYDLADDLQNPNIHFTAAVQVSIALSRIDSTYKPGRFVFLLARDAPATGVPPRIKHVIPDAPNLAGWGRPISATDFGPGEQLAAVLARVDRNLLGVRPDERVSPHQAIKFEFDDPMSNMVVSVVPAGPPLEPKGIELAAQTTLFVTPFTEATSDTAIGMAPDTRYEMTALANWSVIHAPIVTGTQNDQGQFLIPNLDDALYAQLRAQGYTDQDLAGETRYSLRTGPFRITAPSHLGNINLTSAPNGMLIGHLQFAAPTDGLQRPATLDVSVAPEGLTRTSTRVGFPLGTPDTIKQDGFTRTAGVTVHNVPIQLPTTPFDDLVAIDMLVHGSGGEILGRDSIKAHYDTIAPTIGPGFDITNTYTDGQLDRFCVTADCDVATFQIQVGGGRIVTLDRSSAQVSACTNDKAQYCFTDVSLGLGGDVTEDGEIITITATDDQGNVSSPVQTTTSPRCKLYDKYISTGGKLSAVASGDDGKPRVLWSDNRNLFFSQPNVSGSFETPKQRVLLSGSTTTIPANHTFGLGIDMMLDPTDRNPIACFIDATIESPGVETSFLGTLHVLKRQNGTWTELSSIGGVRPLGCSLSTIGNVPVVGWIAAGSPSGGIPQWGFAQNLPSTASVIPLPAAADVHRATRDIWDLDIAGDDTGRLYFAYRTAHPVLGFLGAPGSIIAGYLRGTQSHVQIVCPAGGHPTPDGCTLSLSTFLGWGPKIVVDEHGLGIAFVSVQDIGGFFFTPGHRIEVLGADGGPSFGDDIDFSARFRSNPDALSGLTQDGLTAGNTSAPLLVPFGPIAFLREEGTLFLAAWARGDRLGVEDVVVARINPVIGGGTITVVDRRVQTNDKIGERTETVAVSLSSGPTGYQMVYRNPAVGRLAFAAEQETIPASGAGGTFGCSRAWSTSTIAMDELSLTYQVPGQFFTAECSGVADSIARLFIRPYTIGQSRNVSLRDERIGGQDTLLRDAITPERVVTFSDGTIHVIRDPLILQNGRAPSFTQKHVCLPASQISNGEPDFTACGVVPTSNPNFFDPPAVTQTAQGTPYVSNGGSQPVASIRYTSLTDAKTHCVTPSAGGNTLQVLTDSSNPGSPRYSCVECLRGSWFDPTSSRCKVCSNGAGLNDFRYNNDAVGQFRFELERNGTNGTDQLSCLACPATSPSDVAKGVMPWLATPNGSCTRCTEGSVLRTCETDEDCLVFPNARCSHSGWNGRAHQPNTGVCTTQCSSDADCLDGLPAGSATCVPHTEVDPNTQVSTVTHTCERADHGEQITGRNLLCRPIGCDTCWNNDYCTSDADCPANHHCYNGDFGVLSPACIARPILSKTFERDILDAASGIDPAGVAKAKAELQVQRQNLLDTLDAVKIPNYVQSGPFRVVEFDTRVHDISLQSGNGIAGPIGTVVMHLEFEEASFQIDQPLTAFGSTNGGWSMDFVFAPYVALAGQNESDAYSNLGFTLVDVRVHGDIAWIPDVLFSIDDFATAIKPRLGKLANKFMDSLIAAVGGLEADGTGRLDRPGIVRCIFAHPDNASNLPLQCPSKTKSDGTEIVGSVPNIGNVFLSGDVLTLHSNVCR